MSGSKFCCWWNQVLVESPWITKGYNPNVLRSRTISAKNGVEIITKSASCLIVPKATVRISTFMPAEILEGMSFDCVVMFRWARFRASRNLCSDKWFIAVIIVFPVGEVSTACFVLAGMTIADGEPIWKQRTADWFFLENWPVKSIKLKSRMND